ncbi:MAG TPA: hypothetical protein VMU30_00330 [Bacteroidota bacterium]|nr:hypothetical protein [Bacteroidota bacterium]
MHSHIRAILLLVVFVSSTAFSQLVTTVVPSLEISPSPEANGQGETSVSRITDDPYAVNSNPAHLGFLGSQPFLSASFYPSKTQWLPGSGNNELTYNSFAATGGLNCEKYFSIPLTIGIAYSKVDLNYGTWTMTDGYGNSMSGNVEEYTNAFSFGAGLDVGIQIALGITFRKIDSKLGPYGPLNPPSDNSIWSRDYGLLINIPVIDLVDREIKIFPVVSPLCNVSFGTALTNVGDKMTYIDKAQQSSLPRMISLGTTIDLGIKYSPTDHKLISISWTRESSSLLVGYSDTLGTTYYRGGFADIDFIKNIIEGKQTNQTQYGVTYSATNLSQGWQLGLGEIIYVRGGSFQSSGINLSTSGIGIRAKGIFKLLEDFQIPEPDFIALLHRHFDVRYDYCKYHANDYGPMDGTTFSSFSVTVKL